MDVAWDLAERGMAHGTAVITMEQTQGRGRFGRPWVSAPNDSLALSVVLRPDPILATKLSVLSGLAVVRAIQTVTEVRSTIKWPNDVRIAGKKVCGILVELRADTAGVVVAVVGVGLNLSLDASAYPDIQDTAASLRAATGRDLDVPAAAEAVLTALDETYAQAVAGADVVAAWRDTLDTLGVRITARTVDREETGVAEDVADDGSLLLRRNDGSLVRLSSAEVTIQG